MSDEFTHFNAKGEAHMVDVGNKAVTQREAVTAVIPSPLSIKLMRRRPKGRAAQLTRTVPPGRLCASGHR